MKLPDETLAQIRVKMLLIAHHEQIIEQLRNEAEEIVQTIYGDGSDYEVNIETGEVVAHAQ